MIMLPVVLSIPFLVLLVILMIAAYKEVEKNAVKYKIDHEH